MIVIANVFGKFKTVKSLVRALCKKCRFRIRFDSQHVKASEMHGKCPYEHFYHFFFVILREGDLENVSHSVR